MGDQHRFVSLDIPKCAGLSVRQLSKQFDSYAGKWAGVMSEHPELATLDMGQIYNHLGLPPASLENPTARLHAAGTIKYLWLNRILRHQGIGRSLLKRILPFRLRSALKFSVEQFKITTADPQNVPDEVLRDYNWVVAEQKKFPEDAFGVHCPWQEWNTPK
jgi:hypothetical protein